MNKLVQSETEEDIVGASGSNYGTTPTVERRVFVPFSMSSTKKWFAFWWNMPRRYYVAIMAFLGFCNVYALRVNLSIAILKMTRNEEIVLQNGTIIQVKGDFYYWDTVTVGLVLGAFFYGYIFTQLPAGWLACHFGGKLLLGAGVAASGILTLATPPAAHWGKGAIITVRVMLGFFQGVSYPSVQAIWSHWAPSAERTRLATIAVSGSYFGTVIAMPLSAAIGEQFGWPMIFYFFGILAIVWSAFWFYTVAESPADDRRISKEELTYIQSSVGFTFENVKLLKMDDLLDEELDESEFDSENDTSNVPTHSKLNMAPKLRSTLRPPWRAIFTSGAVWAIIASHFAENWGFYTMLTKLPAFMKEILRFNLEETGFLGALPYLAMGILIQFAGHFSDYLRTKRNWNTVAVRKIFNSIGLAVQSIFTLAIAYSTSPAVTVACITVAVGFGGFVWSAFSVNQLDIAPQYASILMGISNTIATLPGMVAPVVVGLIVEHGTLSEWRIVLYIVAAVYVAGALVYVAFAKADRQRWAEVEGGLLTRMDELDRASRTAVSYEPE